MRAIVYHRYGSPDVLELQEIEKPVPRDTEVLIKVRAAGVNPYDWHFLRGTPRPIRLMIGLLRPKSIRLGADVAGEIEAVGKNTTYFKPGEPVYGTCQGSFAEFACAAESTLAIKPYTLTFAQAASVPIAALTALQGLRDKAQLQAGQAILINGASGGAGTFAVQIAKNMGAEVTGVCSSRNLELVRSIGAHHVVDYTRQDFTTAGRRYDVIFDLVANHSLSAFRRALKPRGVYIAVGAGGPEMRTLDYLGLVIRPMVLAPLVSQTLTGFLAKLTREDLDALRELLESEKLVPIIDRQYTLPEVPDAIRYLENGHARGKVVIKVD